MYFGIVRNRLDFSRIVGLVHLVLSTLGLLSNYKFLYFINKCNKFCVGSGTHCGGGPAGVGSLRPPSEPWDGLPGWVAFLVCVL